MVQLIVSHLNHRDQSDIVIGTNTSVFSICFYNVNQMPLSLELIFTVKPQGLHVLLVKIWKCTYYVIPC